MLSGPRCLRDRPNTCCVGNENVVTFVTRQSCPSNDDANRANEHDDGVVIAPQGSSGYGKQIVCALCTGSEETDSATCSSPAQGRNRGDTGALCNTSNPINSATGNKYQRESDYPGLPDGSLRFARYYNSTSFRDVTKASFHRIGHKWTHTYSKRLKFAPIESGITQIVAERATGRSEFFEYDGTIVTPAAGTRLTLAPAGSNWALTTKDGLRNL